MSIDKDATNGCEHTNIFNVTDAIQIGYSGSSSSSLRTLHDPSPPPPATHERDTLPQSDAEARENAEGLEEAAHAVAVIPPQSRSRACSSASLALLGLGDTYTQVPLRVRVRIWVALVLAQCISNIDSGGCAVLATFPNGQITKEFGLNAFEVGFVLSAMYLGHTLGCLTAAYLLMRYSGKYLLCGSLVLYAFCALGFALSNGYTMALIVRLVGGFVSALLVVYGPLWVDDFGPASSKSLWMSLVQAGVPLGVTIGYLAVGFVEANTSFSWRYFFYGQSGLLLLAAIFFLANPDKALNRPLHITATKETHINPAGEKDTLGSSGATKGAAGGKGHAAVHGKTKARRVLKRIARLMLNPVYILLIFALCALYFVVNGLQMWVTSYLEGPPVEANKNGIVGVFGVCSATGPVAGVLFGGWAIDRVGGYSNVLRTSLVSTVLGGLACVMAFVSLFVTTLPAFAACTWILLFFGGAVVPALVGMSLSTVETRLRPLASGFGSCMYNLLGFFAGPFLAGAVADWAGVQWGYRTIMGTSSIAVVCTGLVVLISFLKERRDTTAAGATDERAHSPQRPLLAIASDTDASEGMSPEDTSFSNFPDRAKQAVLRASFVGGRPSLAFPRHGGYQHVAVPEEDIPTLVTEAAAKGHVVTIS